MMKSSLIYQYPKLFTKFEASVTPVDMKDTYKLMRIMPNSSTVTTDVQTKFKKNVCSTFFYGNDKNVSN